MVIAIINQKGGTGKTTTSQNLGIGLAKKGHSVLMIDLDPQGNLSYSFGVNEFDGTLADVLFHDRSINDVIVKTHNLELVPSDINLANTELFLSNHENRESVLKRELEKLDREYDCIIIDCQTSLSVLTINALMAAQRVIIPMEMTILSVNGLNLILLTVEQVRENLNPELEVLGILPVMIDRRRNLTAEVKTLIKENFDVKIFDAEIANSVRVAEAPSFGLSVLEYAPHSAAAKSYEEFTCEIIKLNEKENNKKMELWQ